MAYINKQLIFYHVPKTGGRWVEKAMANCGLLSGSKLGRFFGEKEGIKPEGRPLGLRRQHSTPLAMLGRFKKGRYQFCFVRRPFEWYRSYWCYKFPGRRTDPRLGSSRARFPLDRLWKNDFEEFLRAVLEMYPEGFVQQVYKCFVGPENNWMDFVGRQENLTDDLILALNGAGCDFDESVLRSTLPVNINAGNPALGEKAVASHELVKAVESAEYWVLKTFYY